MSISITSHEKSLKRLHKNEKNCAPLSALKAYSTKLTRRYSHPPLYTDLATDFYGLRQYEASFYKIIYHKWLQ